MTHASLARRLEGWFEGWVRRAESEDGRLARRSSAGPVVVHHTFPAGSSHAPLLDSLAGGPETRTRLTLHSFELGRRSELGAPWSASDLDRHDRPLGLAGTPWRLMQAENGQDLRCFNRETGVGIFLTVGPTQPWEWGAPLLPFLYWCAAAHGAVMAHAGCIGTPTAMGIVGGPSRTGKSTTVLLGLRAGLVSCGDDFIWLQPADGGTTVHLVYRTVKTVPGAELVPERPERTEWNGSKDVHWLGVADGPGDVRSAGGLVRTAPLGLAWHLSGPARSGPVTALDLLTRLLPSTVLRVPGDERHASATLRRAVAGLPIVELPRNGDYEAVAHLLKVKSGAGAPWREPRARG